MAQFINTLLASALILIIIYALLSGIVSYNPLQLGWY